MTITRALIVVALVLAMAGIQQTAIGFGQENEERLSRSTLGIPQMGDATYRVYDVKPMFHNKTGEPIYWVTAGVLQPSALGDIEPNKVELYWLPRDSNLALEPRGTPFKLSVTHGEWSVGN